MNSKERNKSSWTPKKKHYLIETLIEAVNRGMELAIKRKQNKTKSNLDKGERCFHRTIRTNRHVDNKHHQRQSSSNLGNQTQHKK